MSQIIRWGILGTGNIARKFADGLRLAVDAELVAVGSRAIDTARKFGQEFSVPRCHGSYADLAADASVDVVYVASPHSAHKENMMLCLEHGKAVLCEKPFTINEQQASEAIALARRKRLFLMEAMWTRFLPLHVRLRQLLAEGIIGEPRMVAADFGFRTAADPRGRLFDPNLGGGSLLDVGVYAVSLASMVFGEPLRVGGLADIDAFGVDEQAAFTLAYEGGRLACLYSAITTATPQEATIMGTSGLVRLHAPWWKGGRMTVTVGGASADIDLPIKGNGYQYQADEVAQHLREGRIQSDLMPPGETLAIMRTMDRLRALWGLKYPME